MDDLTRLSIESVDNLKKYIDKLLKRRRELMSMYEKLQDKLNDHNGIILNALQNKEFNLVWIGTEITLKFESTERAQRVVGAFSALSDTLSKIDVVEKELTTVKDILKKVYYDLKDIIEWLEVEIE